MSGWSYNLIDLYVSNKPNQLDETSIGNTNWTQISLYALMRDRPQITPSTNNSSKITIPGRPGELYSSIKQRTNAKIAFELLVVDAWPFANLMSSDDPSLKTVYNRMFYVKRILDEAKRISYKEPGKTAFDYFEVLNVTTELSDADEKAAVIKCTMEVFPFKYNFDGNQAMTINAGATATDQNFNLRPYGEGWPIIVSDPFNSSAYNFSVSLTCTRKIIIPGGIQTETISSGTVYVPQDKRANFGTAISRKSLIIDTGAIQAYDGTNKDPMNKYLRGAYDSIRTQPNTYVTITNNSSVAIKFYSRRGIAI